MANLLYTTKEVFNTYLKARTFKVPEYQRGYKWSDKQIAQLLNDIAEFEQVTDDETFYCLQNITLYPSSTQENVLHIVDGQQRLTTILLLYCYLGMEEILAGKFHYAVRKSSNRFITMLQQDGPTFISTILKPDSFDTFCTQRQEEDFDHQDIFYMYQAIKTFEHWFSNRTGSIEEMRERLLYHVKFIVNEIHSDIKEQELFMNLNTGKVPLDGADLVRAVIITRVAREEMQQFSASSVKDLIRLNEKRTRIGWELDQLNQWWAGEDVKQYYGAFCRLGTDPGETIAFDNEINPINILYKLWAETRVETGQQIKLRLFENTDITSGELYADLIFLNRTLQDWISDRQIYHFLGYLANNKRSFSFKHYYQLWLTGNTTRNLFIQELKEDIRSNLFGSEKSENSGAGYYLGCIKNYQDENKTNWYEHPKVEEFLVLVDVIDIAQDSRTHFLSPAHFKKNKEDKEHIYPCTPKSIRELEHLENGFEAIYAYLEKIMLPLDELFPFTKKEWEKKGIEDRVAHLKTMEGKIHQLTPINSIGNLVLLHYSINRGFGNDYYIDKRASVIRNVQENEYVRQHTLNVFVKGRSTSKNLNDWSFSDICDNADYIEQSIATFFNLEQIIDES